MNKLRGLAYKQRKKNKKGWREKDRLKSKKKGFEEKKKLPQLLQKRWRDFDLKKKPKLLLRKKR